MTLFSSLGGVRNQMGVQMGHLFGNGRCPDSLVLDCQLYRRCFLPRRYFSDDHCQVDKLNPKARFNDFQDSSPRHSSVQ